MKRLRQTSTKTTFTAAVLGLFQVAVPAAAAPPRDGEYVEHWRGTNVVMSRGRYKNGLREGRWEEYRADGKLDWVKHFLGGRLHGVKEQYDNACGGGGRDGRDWVVRTDYFLGKEHGGYVARLCSHVARPRRWVVTQEGRYYMGKREGEWKTYDWDGTGRITSTATYRCGVKIGPTQSVPRWLADCQGRRQWMLELAQRILDGLGGLRKEGCPRPNTGSTAPRDCFTIVLPPTWPEDARRDLASALKRRSCQRSMASDKELVCAKSPSDPRAISSNPTVRKTLSVGRKECPRDKNGRCIRDRPTPGGVRN